ncbi:hypothetical protein [Sulfuricurvum sp.]|uniref:hypothetical protein n=1 Tax=Sulfuricurvum sp. TaxID=2025608 RepID=UPI0035617130
MPFAQQNPEVYKKIKNERYGYICPECGNVEKFQQYINCVKDLMQDDKTGKIIWYGNDTDMNLKPHVTEVQCAECGATAQKCKKGITFEMEFVI